MPKLSYCTCGGQRLNCPVLHTGLAGLKCANKSGGAEMRPLYFGGYMYDKTEGRIRGRRLQAMRLKKWTENPCCAICGRLTEYPAGFELDHVVPLFKGGEDNEDNMQILCVAYANGIKTGCHEDKTNKDLGRRAIHGTDDNGWPV